MQYSTKGASVSVVWIWFIMKKERSKLEPGTNEVLRKIILKDRFKSGR